MVERNPCKKCGSSDGLTTHENGSVYCYACDSLFKHSGGVAPKEESEEVQKPLLEGLAAGEYMPLRKRLITESTCHFYGYQIGKINGATHQIANYCDNLGTLNAQKLRDGSKNFFWLGNPKPVLYGQWLFEKGKKLVITEGEIDCLTVSQVTAKGGMRWPTVSLQNGAGSSGAVPKEILKNLEWLENFEEIILCLDQDEPGRKTALAIADALIHRPVFIVSLPLKDANEMLTAGKGQELNSAIYNAVRYKPNDVISPADITRQELADMASSGFSTPFPKLDAMTNGIKPSRIYTLVAKPKRGKTTVTKEIVLHLLEQGAKVGIMYLEEDHVRAAASLLAMSKSEAPANLDELLLDEEFTNAFVEDLRTLGGGNLLLFSHRGSYATENLLRKIRYMISGAGCDVVVLDNISLSISGENGDGGERKIIDMFMHNLVSIVQSSKASFINVVHVVKNVEGEFIDANNIRGSGAYQNFSNVIIALERNEHKKFHAHLKILDNRETGKIGYADLLAYNPDTGRLRCSSELLPHPQKQEKEYRI